VAPTASSYIVDRNINYTNVCVADCGFCGSTAPKHGEGYTLFEQIGAKIEETGARWCSDPHSGRTQPVHPVEWY
jgi:2-iminoacetate synthase ThiH